MLARPREPADVHMERCEGADEGLARERLHFRSETETEMEDRERDGGHVERESKPRGERGKREERERDLHHRKLNSATPTQPISIFLFFKCRKSVFYFQPLDEDYLSMNE